ncbi:MAG: hypothetical protein K0V04_29185, partial [Deltaproteobacteria bacterium]|nr:hypothetical protein [Deltaproteobacteria bacterium]
MRRGSTWALLILGIAPWACSQPPPAADGRASPVPPSPAQPLAPPPEPEAAEPPPPVEPPLPRGPVQVEARDTAHGLAQRKLTRSETRLPPLLPVPGPGEESTAELPGYFVPIADPT